MGRSVANMEMRLRALRKDAFENNWRMRKGIFFQGVPSKETAVKSNDDVRVLMDTNIWVYAFSLNAPLSDEDEHLFRKQESMARRALRCAIKRASIVATPFCERELRGVLDRLVKEALLSGVAGAAERTYALSALCYKIFSRTVIPFNVDENGFLDTRDSGMLDGNSDALVFAAAALAGADAVCSLDEIHVLRADKLFGVKAVHPDDLSDFLYCVSHAEKKTKEVFATPQFECISIGIRSPEFAAEYSF